MVVQRARADLLVLFVVGKQKYINRSALPMDTADTVQSWLRRRPRAQAGSSVGFPGYLLAVFSRLGLC